MDIKKKILNRIISLQFILKKTNNDIVFVENILKEFKSRVKNTVEDFLHNKAIDFERNSLSATHLIYDENGERLLGYFTLANKSLIISKEDFEKMSKTEQKRFSQSGRILENGSCIVNSFLLAQIGKNYNILDSEYINGFDILDLSYSLLSVVKEIINTKYVWLECENNKSLINFYLKYGFNLLEHYNSKNGLKTMILKIEN